MANKSKKHKQRIKERQREAWQAQKSQRKTVRHNTAVNQEKHRADWQTLQPNEFGVVADRRIMPRDELERRERVEMLSAQAIAADFDEAVWQRLAAATPYALGLVIEVSKGLCRVALDGEIIVCDWRGALIAEQTGYTNIIAVGDRVLVSLQEEGHGFVQEVLPRRSGLGRADPFYGHLRQLLTANVDQVLIVAAWREPHLWLQMVDEYLIGAERNNLTGIVCINKVDLAEEMAEVEALLRPYQAHNHPILYTSTVTGEGLAELTAVLRNKTTVLAGLSGVGKSTLINSIDTNLNLRTARISNMPSREGRHTTTQAVMYPLEHLNGYVIDTPGIKDMGLLGLDAEELLDYYPDIAEFVPECRFSNCQHEQEPGCAVRDAVENGRIAQWRYDNYIKLYARLAQAG
ncbi:MAG: ribosome small subunit-dependent GTPase A [Ardenticatenaceae bacterium]|nr:ribosome small subunit-dependent GTPase A [Ardenticatenaceae bacterium]